MALELYDVLVALAGITLLGTAVLPRVVDERPISMPLFFVALGIAVFALPWFPAPDPLQQGHLTERLAELGVIVALMALGLKIDRPPGLRAWASTWRLLAITMPLSILGAAFLGWWVAGLLLPSAVLLGAVVAPTDPVLASEVQVPDPGEGMEAESSSAGEFEQEVRFALSSEAGLNDGFAFPFTNLAIALALVGIAPSGWSGEWLLVDVAYRIGVGAIVGVGLGRVLARIIFATMPETRVGESVKGVEAVAGTLIVYGITELLGAYGFIAVFVAATTIREHERTHEYQDTLHSVTELSEQALLGLIMVFFGGALVGGLLAPLSIEAAFVAIAIVFLVRPAAGLVGLLGFDAPWIGRSWLERGVIAFFGVRGIGSFYYLAHGLNEAAFAGAELVWAVVGFVVLISIVVHGITATPVVSYVTRRE